eukprot:comp12785_c0_seq1/m.7919 comp12785_c0_seq1/g.7919  ORF comp12785_c0_seq1/g.7919 comp12785_c0_seq1/m.7919 type:complete len:319 (-) comp12785_c0_seq1:893-1849(-)
MSSYEDSHFHHPSSFPNHFSAGRGPSNFNPGSYRQNRYQYRSKPRQDHQTKRRHSVDALDFSKDWVYDVPSFLRTLRLHKYIDILGNQNVRFEDLLTMSEDDLTNIGISTQGARKRMYLAIQKYRNFMDAHNMPAPKPLGSSPGSNLATRRRLSAPCVPALSSWITSELNFHISALGEEDSPDDDDFEIPSPEMYATTKADYETISDPSLDSTLEEIGARLLDDLLTDGPLDESHVPSMGASGRSGSYMRPQIARAHPDMAGDDVMGMGLHGKFPAGGFNNKGKCMPRNIGGPGRGFEGSEPRHVPVHNSQRRASVFW